MLNRLRVWTINDTKVLSQLQFPEFGHCIMIMEASITLGNALEHGRAVGHHRSIVLEVTQNMINERLDGTHRVLEMWQTGGSCNTTVPFL
jgi:hypothetical protein